MDYTQALALINNRLRFGSKPGLERIGKLCAALGNPQDSLRFVHVAGTNGKGTTCTLIACALKAAGYHVGLYTSPYVIDFRERFQIDNEMISENELIDAVQAVAPAAAAIEADGEEITEFELITALAFYWFKKRNCDFVVLEVGLGGRFDATNIIHTPVEAVIASISLDHTQILGDTLPKIAFEKAGIIKPGGDVTVYPEQGEGVIEVFRDCCRERGAHLTVADLAPVQIESTGICGSRFSYGDLDIFVPFTGTHQVKNAVTALTALLRMRGKGVNIPNSAIEQGFCSASIPARMELLRNDPPVLIDGGHNPGCAQALAKVLDESLSGRTITAIMGIMADKDSETVLSILAPRFTHVLTVKPENPRAMSAQELASRASAHCADCRAFESMDDAFCTALSLAGKEGAVVICGSFYMAGDMRRIAAKYLK